jgi:uncharacterized protein involved in high-affinity Fe2+ transport
MERARTMLRRWARPLITLVILSGVLLILLVNLNLGTQRLRPAAAQGKVHSYGFSWSVNRPWSAHRRATGTPTPTAQAKTLVPSTSTPSKPAGFREYPIGDEVERNFMRIAAVWLPPVAMDGSGIGGSDVIHLEADVKAIEGNPHGFALGEFVPYLRVSYAIVPEGGGEPVQAGVLMPMVAADGLHYGASVSMPAAGQYRLTYKFDPPSAGGLGRHSDPATGVAPWWPPFEVAFDWDYAGPPK